MRQLSWMKQNARFIRRIEILEHPVTLEAYLSSHFVDKATFASLANISPARLDALIAADAVPAASYVCREGVIRSAAFGEAGTSEPIEGDFFRPECARWVLIADQAAPGGERSEVIAVLEGELKRYLQSCGLDASAVEAKVASLLPHFFNGTFGLCVAEPSSGVGIAKKEFLQDKLVALTRNGTEPAPAGIRRSELLKLVDDYANAAMPFSPAEYDRSSRKRLVDDFRLLLAND